MKKTLVGLVLLLVLIACAPAQEQTKANEVADQVKEQSTEETEAPQTTQPTKTATVKETTSTKQETTKQPTQTSTQPKTETKQADMDPQIRDLKQRAEDKVKSLSYIYGGTETGNLFLDTYHIHLTEGEKIKVQLFEEDDYVRDGHYTHIYLHESVACCEIPNRCKSHNVDNTGIAFEYDSEGHRLPKTPYQWTRDIPASATVIGPQTIDERSVTYLGWKQDGRDYFGWFDDTYGVAHKIEVRDGENLVMRYQFNDLIFNSLKADDMVPPCV